MKRLNLLLSIGILSSCATLFNEDYQQVNIVTSTGEKTKVKVDGQIVEAPDVVKVPRSQDPLIIKTSGKRCAKRTIARSEVASVFWINILSSGPFGSTTDYMSDDMWE